MARPNKQKITTQSEVGGGLFQAFASLDASGLPEGPPSPQPEAAPESSRKMGRVVLRKETAHRGGKSVLVIDGFEQTHSDASLQTLAKQLRQHCGCGGALKHRTIELQGEPIAKVRTFLEGQGFKVAGIR